jgi:hypothetical protein
MEILPKTGPQTEFLRRKGYISHLNAVKQINQDALNFSFNKNREEYDLEVLQG